MEETIFDKIINKEIPADVVYEDDNILAFRDINPQAPVHVLVIPKQKVASFNDLKDRPAEETGIFLQGVSRVAVELGLAGDGYRIVMNCGSNGQQTVEYLHAHILGERQMNWPPG
ncbi:histidine triad nucleotide-binding protein [Spirochaeta isovalerica]|uniref:Histidine triad (HIT) family protein n=1 Tax=Spirochaeta isovalerica TaxID=150 RepID=A0A841R2D5_9SPIO|nr:histidine triad nucleotide-binding protein [Spirochaeta isovalerica]MBB6479184.1 histidine triad (HIT) family protein [Spirochaeta isovalerica]